jgi:hypothetical protein
MYMLPGSTPSVSASGTTNGIIWDIDLSTNQLRAYNATGYDHELYTSAQAANNRDALGSAIRFTVPTVVNGDVYVGTTNSIVAYGLLNAPASVSAASTAPTLNPLPGLSQAGSNNVSASVDSGLSSDPHGVVPGSDEENSTRRLDGLFGMPIVKGSSAGAFVPLNSNQSVPKHSRQTTESDALPVSAIDEVFSNF